MTSTIRDEIKWRDEWIRGVLADSELSPFARLVGVRLGLSVDLDDWPNIRLGVDDCAAVAADIGVPGAVVARAITTYLHDQRHWLAAFQYTNSDALHFQLNGGPRHRGMQAWHRYHSRNKQRIPK
jgi:hypothetical protein